MKTSIAMLAAALSGVAWAGQVDRVLPDGVRVHIEEAPCSDPAACASGSARFLGRGNHAKTRIAAITVSTGERSYRLDASDMIDPLLDGTWRNFGGFCYDERNCSFRGVFGDGGASYAAEWQVIEGRPVRTVLSDSLDLVQFFQANLTPPRYE